MSNELMRLFEYEEREVRVLIIDNEPWWVANDVCVVLGIEQSRNAVARLDPDDVRQADAENRKGQFVQMNIINESGLYELIIRSDKPNARAFRRWVTSEVLPSIRRTGGYAESITSAEGLLAAVQRLVDNERKQRELEREARRQKQIIAVQSAIVVEHEARLDSIEQHSGWIAALAYVRMHKLEPSNNRTVSRLGKAATRLMHEKGMKPPTTWSEVFGQVNLYPEDVLKEAAQLVYGDD